MSRYLLDTNVVSDLVRRPHGPSAAAIARVGEAAVFTSVVVAAELRYGALKKGSAALADRVERVLGALPVEPLASGADVHYARIRTALEAQGRPIGGNDLLIAAHALSLGAILVTDNEDEFRRVGGLAVENWVRAEAPRGR